MERSEGKSSWAKAKIASYREDFKKTFLSVPPKKVILNLALVILGNILLAFATVFFLLPAKIVMGGNSGLSLILMEAIVLSTKGNVPAWLDTDFLIFCFTVFFFVLAFILLGFASAVKNTVSAIVYPSFVFAFNALRSVEAWHYLRLEEYMASNPGYVIPGTGYDGVAVTLIAGIFGGFFMGLATALALKGGGSTGGTTCLVIFFSKHTKAKANAVSIVIDGLIILLGMFVYRNLVTGMIGMVTAVIASVVIAKVFVGGSQALHAEIVSPKWEAMSRAIQTEMHRGTTIYTAQGGFTLAEKKVVYVSFSKEEYPQFLALIQRVDPNAFVTITTVYDVTGGVGFQRNADLAWHRKKKDRI